MKSIHTPLGLIRANKKIVAGATALTLVGSIAPALILNSNAAATPVYTTVGPDFFTVIGYDITDSSTMRAYIEDTSIADFYDEDWRCSTEYSCLQGKKTGSTRIVIENYQNETTYIPLTSVKLDSNTYYVQDNRTTVSRTGSITGANNSLLTIDSIDDDEAGAASIEQTGAASYRISSDDIENENTFSITWKIGDQEVGGGTEVALKPIEAHDLVSHDEKNEEILRKATVSLIEANEEVTSLSYYGQIEDKIGNIAYGHNFDDTDLYNFTHNTRTGAPYAIGATLSMDEYIPASENSYNDTKELVFGDKEVKDAHFYNLYSYIGNCVDLISGADYVNSLDKRRAIATYDNESGRVCMNASQIEALAEPITITLDTDAEPVEDGFERTWYTYVPKYDEGHDFVEIPSTYNEEDGTISFSTKNLEAFAIGYIDTEKEEEPTVEPVDEPKEDTPKAPNTGSMSKVATTAVATFLPLMMIVGLAFIARAKKHSSSKLAKKINHFE
jgi:hypothetical protein